MIEPDNVLHELLRRWEAPAASADLNARVLRSYRRSRRPPWRLYAPLAAAAALVLAAGIWCLRPERKLEMASGVSTTRDSVTYATTLNLTGFQPIPNGKIITLKTGEKP